MNPEHEANLSYAAMIRQQQRQGLRCVRCAAPIEYVNRLNLCDQCLRHGASETPAADQNQRAGGLKFDNEKLPWDLLPLQATEEVLQVLAFGAKKYAPHNWRQGIEFSRLYNAAMRHLTAFWQGEDTHEEGLHHLASVICCCMFILEMPKQWDDRQTHVLRGMPEQEEEVPLCLFCQTNPAVVGMDFCSANCAKCYDWRE